MIVFTTGVGILVGGVVGLCCGFLIWVRWLPHTTEKCLVAVGYCTLAGLIVGLPSFMITFGAFGEAYTDAQGYLALGLWLLVAGLPSAGFSLLASRVILPRAERLWDGDRIKRAFAEPAAWLVGLALVVTLVGGAVLALRLAS